MKKLLVFAMAALVAGASFAATAGTDNAGNAAYGDGWASGDNGGTGFGAWTITANGGTTGAAGGFVGDPSTAGLGSLGNPSFGLYAHSDAAAYVDALRSFDSALTVGQSFMFTLGINWDSGSGNKGFSLYSGGGYATEELNINNAGSAAITYSGSSSGTLFANYGTTPMDFIIAYTAADTINVSANGRDGVESFNQSFTVSAAPTGFKFYASNLQHPGSGNDDNPQPYFNDLEITAAPVPEPATMSLLGLGALAMVLRRKIRK